MRVLIVLVALVASPFLASVSQDRAGSAPPAQPGVVEPGKCEAADEHRSPNSWAHDRRPDKKGRDRLGCSPVPPAPPPPPPPPPPPESITITGKVYNDISGRPGLSGWVIEVSGTVTATAVTDASGNYTVAGLPTGTYTICEAVQSGWRQTFPPSGTPCPTGVGYTFSLAAGQGASFVNFGNVIQ